MPFTLTTNAPVVVVAAAGDTTPLISIATTVPLIGTPTAAVPTKLALLDELLTELLVAATDEVILEDELKLDETTLDEVTAADDAVLDEETELELATVELIADELAGLDKAPAVELVTLEVLDAAIEDATTLLAELAKEEATTALEVELARLELVAGVELLLEPPPHAVRLTIKAQ